VINHIPFGVDHPFVATRVLIAIDDPRLRARARVVVASSSAFEVVVSDEAGAVAARDRQGSDVVVIELSAPVADPLRGSPLVALAADDMPMARGLVDLGVHGLVAIADLHELAKVVTAVADGDVAASTHAAPRLITEMLRMHDDALDANAALEFAREALAAQLNEMRASYRSTVEVLTNAVELRDEYTGGHVRRVCDYSLAIARLVAPGLCEEPFVYGYLLHDVGKLAIPDAVLLKPGALTDEEYELIKSHTTLGAQYIEKIPFLTPALAVVRSHHERWDGNGYPDGLAGLDIPLIARIFTVADSLDAMTTDRPYRAGRPLEAALEEFDRCTSTQFDPEMVRALRWVVQRDDAFALLRNGVVPGREVPLLTR